MATFDEGALYRVEWADQDGGLLRRLSDVGDDVAPLSTLRAGDESSTVDPTTTGDE